VNARGTRTPRERETELDVLDRSPHGAADKAALPAYLHIAQTLAERLDSGLYAAGSRLPSGSELQTEFGVSPMTVRRALSLLEQQGLIVGVKGRGVYACCRGLADSAFRLDSLSGDWLDESADIRLLSASMTRADQRVAEMLHLTPDDRVVQLRRVVLSVGLPAMYHTEYILYDPRRPLVESQLQLTSLHAFLDSGGAQRFPRGELTVTAVKLDSESAHVLEESEGALALRLEHVFRERDGTPVSWGWFLLRAELFRLRAVLGST
jgi:DNA-binding GntR family transcriptional regulator